MQVHPLREINSEHTKPHNDQTQTIKTHPESMNMKMGTAYLKWEFARLRGAKA
jgi:hypothetical protein